MHECYLGEWLKTQMEMKMIFFIEKTFEIDICSKISEIHKCQANERS